MEITQDLEKTLNHFRVHQGDSSYLISFEGIEGSGKTTQIKLLESQLKDMNFEVLTLREPGGTSFGEALRRTILNSTHPITPTSEAYLFAASRAQLLHEKVLPFLEKKNHIVLLDRYIDSSIAYQGVARNLGVENVLKIHEVAPLNIMPNLTFYLSITLKTSMERQEARSSAKDYFEMENDAFYAKLIEGFELSSHYFKDRIIKLDASCDIQTLSQKIIKKVKEII